LFLDAAQMHGGNAQIGGDHMLGDAVVDIGEDGIHERIALSGGEGVEVLDAGIQVNEIELGDETTEFLPLLHVYIAPVNGFFGHDDRIGLFQCLQVIAGLFAGEEGIVIGYELIFDGKMGSVFASFQVGDHHPNDAFFDEVDFIYVALGLAQEGFFAEGFAVALGDKSLHLRIGEGDEALDSGLEGLHGGKIGEFQGNFLEGGAC